MAQGQSRLVRQEVSLQWLNLHQSDPHPVLSAHDHTTRMSCLEPTADWPLFALDKIAATSTPHVSELRRASDGHNPTYE